MEQFKKFIDRIKYLLYVMPLLLGLYGYMVDFGHSFWESLYGAMAIYFVSQVFEDQNGLILVASIWAMLVTANFIIVIAQTVFGSLDHVWINRFADSTAVYGDKDKVEAYLKNSTHSYAGKFFRGKPEKAKNIVLMYEQDLDNINFANDYEQELKDRKLYIQLQDVDSFLIGKNQGDIHYFNTFELVARKFWKDYPIDYKLVRENKSYKIALVGFGQMGRAITRYGILDNIFDLKQAIEYHIFGADKVNADFLTGLELMNDDRVIAHDENADEGFEQLKEMDRIIVINDSDMRLTQELLYSVNCPEIFYYTEDSVDMSKIFASDRIVAFGDIQEIITEECIRNESLIRVAKLFNFDYNSHYGYGTGDMEKDWSQLNGFLKGSNIARADHYRVERNMLENGVDTLEVMELEHIRWARFHYINHWTYAPVRDNAKHQHNLLVPFSELDEDKKSLDGINNPEIEKEILALL